MTCLQPVHDETCLPRAETIKPANEVWVFVVRSREEEEEEEEEEQQQQQQQQQQQ